MPKTLVIAEKPSVASDIAKALGGFTKENDFFENDRYVVSSAVGHLYEIHPAEGYEPARGKWDFFPSLPESFDLQVIEKNAGRAAVLRKLLKRKDVTAVINACDAGREGELIFRNIMRANGSKLPIRRLWLQSMTTESIRAAFAQLREDAELQPLADAALSRSESDWLVGINSTRALTKFNSQGGGFQKTTAGRVQTPTLAILAEREERIRRFEPRAYFEVFGDFDVAAGSYRGRWYDPAFKKGSEEDARAERIWEKEKAEALRLKCLGKTGTIEEEKKASTQAPPFLYDLTTLQREANGRHGFPAKMTLQIAQALYEKHKALTYPRTDSRFLPEDHLGTAREVMGSISDPALARHAAHALQQGWVRPNKRVFDNAKVSDHFAIVPTGTQPKALSEAEQKIFDLVSRRFIEVFYPSAHFETTTRITTVEGEKFRTSAKVITEPGWMAVGGRQAMTAEDSENPWVPIRAGETTRTREVEVKENVTKPPARFNEATLLSAMEGAGKFIDDEELRLAMGERGLGTPATRAQVIEGLIFEGYIVRQGKELIVTQKGLSLITLLRNLQADALTKPELTGEWEFKLKQMERGGISRAAFMQEIRGLTTDLVTKVRGGMGREVHGEFRPLEVACPRCGASPFKETFKAYECDGCHLLLWKMMAGREFERDEAITLLREKRVGPLRDFRSKMGRAFNAVVVLGEDFKQKFDFEEDSAPAGEPPEYVNLEPLGPCRVCQQGEVYETATHFQCEKTHEKKCTFRMGKAILQRTIPREQAVKLVLTGKTDLLPRFISKKGRPFAAYLVLEESGKVAFEFEKRDPAKAKAGARFGARPGAKAPAKTARASRKTAGAAAK